MVRSAVADDRLLSYLHTVSKQNTYSIGLILGQSSSGKDYIIHFAKTPPATPECKDNNPVARLKSVNEVNEEWVADHAKQATRMLPGGMHVLGIFIVSPEDILNTFAAKIKSVLSHMHKHLELQKYLFGNLNNEKLVLNYCSKTQHIGCKSFDVGTSSVKPADFKFLSSPIKWAQINCRYIMDQVYHISENESDWPLKKHMGIILESMNKNLKGSIFLYDGELKEADESLDSISKKKISRGNKSNSHEDNMKPVQVCILQPCEGSDSFEISDSGNQIRIFGHVASKLWINPKISISAASDAVMQDIMRSLSTRLEMHWDSLTEEEHGEDMNSVHEPPRRVLISLPNSNITISDYLFPGEGPQDAKISLEEMLDIKISNDADVMDVEGQADLAEYYNETTETESEEVMAKKITANNKSLYFIGLGVALLVLVISLLIHFMQS